MSLPPVSFRVRKPSIGITLIGVAHLDPIKRLFKGLASLVSVNKRQSKRGRDEIKFNFYD